MVKKETGRIKQGTKMEMTGIGVRIRTLACSQDVTLNGGLADGHRGQQEP